MTDVLLVLCPVQTGGNVDSRVGRTCYAQVGLASAVHGGAGIYSSSSSSTEAEKQNKKTRSGEGGKNAALRARVQFGRPSCLRWGGCFFLSWSLSVQAGRLAALEDDEGSRAEEAVRQKRGPVRSYSSKLSNYRHSKRGRSEVAYSILRNR